MSEQSNDSKRSAIAANKLGTLPPRARDAPLAVRPTTGAPIGHPLLSTEGVQWLAGKGFGARVEIVDEFGVPLNGDEMGAILEEIGQVGSQSTTYQDLAMVGRLAANVSHEVRNILAGVLGLSQLRARSGSEAETFATIATEAARGTQLLSSILSLSRSDDPKPQLTSLAEVFEPIRLLTLAEQKRRQATVHFKDRSEGQSIVVHANHAKQVLLNLILNALQATGQEGLVEVFGEVREQEVLITVDDNGPGVSPSNRNRVFEAFYTTKRERGGTGIGLAKSTQLVQSVGGTLKVLDSPLGGARFELCLPKSESTSLDIGESR